MCITIVQVVLTNNLLILYKIDVKINICSNSKFCRILKNIKLQIVTTM